MTTNINISENAILHGDCIEVLGQVAASSFDFALTDPPYLVRYESRDGRRVRNDDNSNWLQPAFRQIYRTLKPSSYCVSFYGWNRVDEFVDAWREVGFRIVGHLVFHKKYASNSRLLRYHHECAYLLAKGQVAPPAQPIADVIEWKYSGNRLHPTQKPVSALRPLIESFCPARGIVLDPFCGSGSALVAATQVGCRYVGIEVDAQHHRTATERLADRATDAAA